MNTWYTKSYISKIWPTSTNIIQQQNETNTPNNVFKHAKNIHTPILTRGNNTLKKIMIVFIKFYFIIMTF